ncbi:BRISC and BRCA1-A complex member 1 [Carex littledalei]|uniref:BRISC and BRCA1-A complex member 1 n=1 Tax=Carex littledalei TaxID=544730 RepID=A0A833RHQ4_9POAL|nr:BRISC and BRCA1-A complex member 1 [Carex littledalei]
MEGGASDASISSPLLQAATAPPQLPSYSLPPSLFMPEDILFCIDTGPESRTEMRVAGPKGRGVTRLDAIKQALLLFTHSKLTMCTDHRFAFSSLGKTFSWVKREFTNDVKSVTEVVRILTVPETPVEGADITKLFEVANFEAKRSNAQGRLFRVVLIYCRSSTQPKHRWPVNQKTFSMDAVYLHDKPGPDNCPQKVYDALVDAVEHVSQYEGYVFESGQGLTRVLFRHMCVLLSHPAQRCMQDDLDVPRSIVKRAPPVGGEGTPSEESMIISS